MRNRYHLLLLIFLLGPGMVVAQDLHPDFTLSWVLDANNDAFDPGPAWQEALAGGWDIDGDGKGEFFSSFDGSGDENADYVLREFESDGNGGYAAVWQFTVPGQTQLSANQRLIALGDLNGNGRNELFFGVTPADPADPNLYVFESDGSTFPTAPTATLITPRPTAAYFEDPDGDGVFTEGNSQLEWSWEEDYLIDDIDGDGNNELVAIGTGVLVMEFAGDWSDPNAPDDVFYEFQQPAAGETITKGIPFNFERNFAASVAGADLDGDGDKDLAVSFPGWRHVFDQEQVLTNREQPLRIYQTGGDSDYSVVARLRQSTSVDQADDDVYTGFVPDGWLGTNRGMIGTDLDGDGADELVMTNVGGFADVGGSLWVLDADGGALSSIGASNMAMVAEFGPLLPEGVNSATHGLDYGDLDGDGQVEFYVADLDGRSVWRVEYQGGAITSSSSYAVDQIYSWPEGTQPKSLRVGADLDGDGKGEVIIQGPPGNEGGNVVIIESTNDISTDVFDELELPSGYALAQNYPNPFNPTTTIQYTLPAQTNVQVVIYNVLGQVVNTLVDQRMSAGTHQVTWNGRDAAGNVVASGMYFYALETEAINMTRRMVLLK